MTMYALMIKRRSVVGSGKLGDVILRVAAAIAFVKYDGRISKVPGCSKANQRVEQLIYCVLFINW
jgi:hypothetical protein